MKGENMFEGIVTPFNTVMGVTLGYLPKLFGGFLILFIGLIVASLLKDLILVIFKYFKVEKWLTALGLIKNEDVQLWPNLLAELLRWTTIFLFLVSAVDIWGLPRVGELLNQLVTFLPNVLLTVVIGWAGLICGKLAFNIVRHSLRGLSSKESIVLGNIARYTIIFFTVLIILSQLGVAADLVKILFTGIVSMLSLAFGLAFGLGGQDEARDILRSIREKLEKKEKKK